MKKIEIGDRVKVERTGRVGVVVGIGEWTAVYGSYRVLVKMEDDEIVESYKEQAIKKEGR